jgi:hypothetical protein
MPAPVPSGDETTAFSWVFVLVVVSRVVGGIFDARRRCADAVVVVVVARRDLRSSKCVCILVPRDGCMIEAPLCRASRLEGESLWPSGMSILAIRVVWAAVWDRRMWERQGYRSRCCCKVARGFSRYMMVWTILSSDGSAYDSAKEEKRI